MDKYKQVAYKAIEYIMQECEYCSICVNFEPCNKQLEEYAKQGIKTKIDLKFCKDGIMQHFIRESKTENAK